jgi:MoaA/NifB/PqqE/SkfB family radical SAM enzyme
MIAWDHWHIEISSICALQCPRCPRAEVPDSLLNRQLDLNFFQTQISTEKISQIKKITFCGNDGDPIYCKDLIEICRWIKKNNPDIALAIITNGSHRSESWWKELAEVLDHRDEIHWSLDGWDHDSNQLYRKNSNWNSIVNGIRAFAAVNQDTYRIWATIAFQFNENHLLHCQQLASGYGFDLFQLTKSTKFGSRYPLQYGIKDTLEPTNQMLVSQSHRFERICTGLSQRVRPGTELREVFWQRAKNLDKHKQYAGICLIGNKGVFLNSQGHVYPCCWTANRYGHNSKWHDLARSRFNLTMRTLNEIQQDMFWISEFLQFDSLECQTKCTFDKLQDPEHTTEW